MTKAAPMATRFRLAPLVTGAVLLLHLAVLRLFCRAGADWVTVFGRDPGLACAFRAHTGHPCPGCGLTRAVVLSVCGQWAQAFSLNPLGPWLVLGMLLFGMSLVWLGLAPNGRGQVERVLRLGGAAYAAVACVFWIGGWLWRLA